jgi:hypothetical protein
MNQLQYTGTGSASASIGFKVSRVRPRLKRRVRACSLPIPNYDLAGNDSGENASLRGCYFTHGN